MARGWIYADGLLSGEDFLLIPGGALLTALAIDADPTDEDFLLITLDPDGENILRLTTDEKVYLPLDEF